MKHYEKVVPVSATRGEINSVHDPVGFLQQVKSTVVLLLLDELVGAVIEFSQNDRDFVFAHVELLVVVAIKTVVFSD
jgi:hypothetical protein